MIIVSILRLAIVYFSSLASLTIIIDMIIGVIAKLDLKAEYEELKSGKVNVA